jgi:hypothetical protein
MALTPDGAANVAARTSVPQQIFGSRAAVTRPSAGCAEDCSATARPDSLIDVMKSIRFGSRTLVVIRHRLTMRKRARIVPGGNSV